MSSKLFQRRQALKNSPRTASGEGFLSDREENVEEVDTSDVRLAAKKRAEGEAPAPKMNPFKNFPGNALIAIQEAITKLEEYATDKNLQNAVVQIGEEIASRPLAAPAAQPVTAGKKKAGPMMESITPEKAGLAEDGVLGKIRQLLYSIDGTHPKHDILQLVDEAFDKKKTSKKADLESAALREDGVLGQLRKLIYSLDGSHNKYEIFKMVEEADAKKKAASKKKADSVSIDISGGNVHLDVSDGSDSMAAPVPMATPLEPIGEIAPLDVPGDILDETPVEDVTEEAVFEGPEDIDFPKEDWEAEVENEQTKLSYQSWVAKSASKQ